MAEIKISMEKNFIKVKVKTIWYGQAGIRDKYVKQARNEEKGLMISNGLETMTIPFDEVNSSIVAVPEFPFKDYFPSKYHHLIYFKWVVDKCLQSKLFKEKKNQP